MTNTIINRDEARANKAEMDKQVTKVLLQKSEKSSLTLENGDQVQYTVLDNQLYWFDMNGNMIDKPELTNAKVKGHKDQMTYSEKLANWGLSQEFVSKFLKKYPTAIRKEFSIQGSKTYAGGWLFLDKDLQLKFLSELKFKGEFQLFDVSSNTLWTYDFDDLCSLGHYENITSFDSISPITPTEEDLLSGILPEPEVTEIEVGKLHLGNVTVAVFSSIQGTFYKKWNVYMAEQQARMNQKTNNDEWDEFEQSMSKVYTNEDSPHINEQ